MARYSRVALYNKAHNAAHNQMNRTKPAPFRRNIVEIPEAKNSSEMQQTIHKDLEEKETAFTPAVEVASPEAAEQIKSVRSKVSKRRAKKSTAAPKMKKTNAHTKKASSSKMKKTSAKSSAKKMAKKTTVKSAKLKPEKEAMRKKAITKKLATKKMNKKSGAKSTMKGSSMRSK